MLSQLFVVSGILIGASPGPLGPPWLRLCLSVPPGFATVFTPDVMSNHCISPLLQFFLSGSTFVSLVHEYW